MSSGLAIAIILLLLLFSGASLLPTLLSFKDYYKACFLSSSNY
jgi:hypothetical protein